jgi:hypothetical protein
MRIMKLRRSTREVQFWLDLEIFFLERVGVGQVVDAKIAKLLLEATGHETSWREDAMPKEIQGAGRLPPSRAVRRQWFRDLRML